MQTVVDVVKEGATSWYFTNILFPLFLKAACCVQAVSPVWRKQYRNLIDSPALQSQDFIPSLFEHPCALSSMLYCEGPESG